MLVHGGTDRGRAARVDCGELLLPRLFARTVAISAVTIEKLDAIKNSAPL